MRCHARSLSSSPRAGSIGSTCAGLRPGLPLPAKARQGHTKRTPRTQPPRWGQQPLCTPTTTKTTQPCTQFIAHNSDGGHDGLDTWLQRTTQELQGPRGVRGWGEIGSRGTRVCNKKRASSERRASRASRASRGARAALRATNQCRPGRVQYDFKSTRCTGQGLGWDVLRVLAPLAPLARCSGPPRRVLESWSEELFFLFFCVRSCKEGWGREAGTPRRARSSKTGQA